MTTMPSASTPDFLLAAKYLRRLHDMIRSGKGSSPEADELRDEMDEVWGRLTEEEEQRINRLSAALKSKGVPHEPEPKA